MKSKKKIFSASSFIADEPMDIVIPILTNCDNDEDFTEGIDKLESEVPILPLRNMVLFPGVALPVMVGRTKSMNLIKDMGSSKSMIGVVCQRDMSVEDPNKDDLYPIGVIADVLKVMDVSDGMTTVLLQGKKRFELNELVQDEPFLKGRITLLDEHFPAKSDKEFKALLSNVKDLMIKILMATNELGQREMAYAIRNINNALYLINYASANLLNDVANKQLLLMMDSLKERAYKLLTLLNREFQLIELKASIQMKTQEDIDKQQKEYYLREQMKVIREELGDDGPNTEAEAFREAVEKLEASDEVKERIEKEIQRFLNAGFNSAEASVSRGYIEILLDLPWDKRGEDRLDLKVAEDILEKEHYGLEKVKERILEFLAVRKMLDASESPILCLVGPPGTGKTSVARSIAEALNKKYVRICLGGVHDEAEIRGHRRTYIGAMPGRIVDGIRQAGVKNPLMVLDEIDKVSADYKGDTFSALLEVLDSEQNSTFRDHFVELPYDLSKVLFMCTANSLDTIPGPLRDRMEIIELSSYTAQEKLHIAEEHLLEKQRKRHGLTAKQLKIKADAMEEIIDGYTREAGVRQLERTIGEVCRKAVKMILSGERKTLTVTKKNLEQLLGARKFMPDTIYKEPQVGIVRGLAWTRVGGTTLSVEVNCMPGEGKFRVTGNLGKVMTESAEAAVSYIRSQNERFKLEPDFYKKKDIHIHIPEGATPKDGPSAGVTMATAIISALTGRKVRNDVAMTGEITIRGRVLPIGGLQEKVLAAKKVGIKTVILPKENKKDLDEIMDEIKDGMQFVLAETMEDVLQTALVKGEKDA